MVKEKAFYRAVWQVLKYNRDINDYRKPDGSLDYERFFAENEPYEVLEFEGNLLLNNGINVLWQLAIGATGVTPFNNANAYLGVGDSSTAPSASQTGLLGTNRFFKGMDSGYPSVSGTTCTWQATYGGTEANFAWNEAGVANGNNPPTSGTLLNRLVQSMGTKQSGQTWTLRLSITLS